jgi:hypothetical protein
MICISIGAALHDDEQHLTHIYLHANNIITLQKITTYMLHTNCKIKMFLFLYITTMVCSIVVARVGISRGIES